MASDIDDSFVKQFESEVFLAYQRMGARMLNTVRRKSGITGESTTFQSIGTMTAGTKSRNGQVPISNPEHIPTEVTLTDYYVGEFIDKLDELKIQHDERAAVTTNIASALGRKSDDLIIQACNSASQSTATPAAASAALIQEAYETLGNNDVPMDDGELYCALSPAAWTDLLTDPQFSDADWIGPDGITNPGPMPVMGYKVFMGIKFYTHSGLNITGSNRDCPMYHKSQVAHASGADVSIDLTWQGKEQAWLAVGSMSQGAKLLDEADNTGVYPGVFLVQVAE